MLLRGLVAAIAMLVGASALAQGGAGADPDAGASGGGIHVELNKLEQVKNACRAYLVTQNLTQTEFKSLKLDVVMFNNDGIVAKRLAVQIGPMPAGKTSLKVFDIDGLRCDDIGQLLLNDVLECHDAKVARTDCLSLLSVSQRGKVPFIE